MNIARFREMRNRYSASLLGAFAMMFLPFLILKLGQEWFAQFRRGLPEIIAFAICGPLCGLLLAIAMLLDCPICGMRYAKMQPGSDGGVTLNPQRCPRCGVTI
ncbi:MAG TPA: hypothetical protein VH083_04470 [Myxococcales bacterium]|nr:hypothetical protein [Myxococcales bacterium]